MMDWVEPPARYLLRAKDIADRRYADNLAVRDMSRTAGVSLSHFSREFKRAFGVPPHQYLRARRLERAAALLRNTDDSVTDICTAVGLTSLGSFTTTFRSVYGSTPAEYRSMFPPAQRHIRVPGCLAQIYGMPKQSTFGEAPDSTSQ